MIAFSRLNLQSHLLLSLSEVINDEAFLTKDLGGFERTDLGLILDAAEIIGNPEWKNTLLERSNEIQDARLLEVLQS